MVFFPPSMAPMLQLITAITLGLVLLHVAADSSSSSDTLIKVGSSLSPVAGPSSWPSPSGYFAFGFYKEGSGFAVGIWLTAGSSPAPTVVWTLMRRRGGKPFGPYDSTASLTLTEEGLQLISAPNKRPHLVLNLTRYTTYGVVAASMLDSGNLVVYGGTNIANYSTIWESFDHPTDTILGNASLPCGSQLRSSVSADDHTVGTFSLTMQCDGDLVLSQRKHTSWSLGTYGQGYTSLNLDADGVLYLRSYARTRYLSKQTCTDCIFYARLEGNGALQLYGLARDDNKSGLVYSVPDRSDPCQSENPCGQNSYCILVQGKPQCWCLPGFNSTSTHGGPAVRCQRNFNKPSCFEDKGDTNITMQAIENIVWIDEPYSVVNVSSKEECGDECLKDCDCQAVVFSEQSCSKQKLPVKRARIDRTEQTAAYVKVIKPVPYVKKCLNVRALVTVVAVVVVVYAAYFSIGIPIYWLWFGRQQRRWKEWQQLVEEKEIAPRCFSHRELIRATNSFNKVLGRGGFACVYQGTLPHSGRSVAVKRMIGVQEDMDQSFNDELRIIGRIHHRNLVRLLGFSFDGSDRLLVYELMTTGSLADYIKTNSVPKDRPEWQRRPEWKERMRIAVEVARGICYLHHSCVEPIIHCDIKPENILLGENYGTVKVADFGEGKRLKPGQTRSSTRSSANRWRGTEAYAPPEWLKPGTSASSIKADVYSFGIVLLELVYWTRDSPPEDNPDPQMDDPNAQIDDPKAQIDDQSPRTTDDEHVLLRSVCERYGSGKAPEPSDGDDIEPSELERVVKIGIWCIQPDPASRPYMKDVLKMLEGKITKEDPTPIPLSTLRRTGIRS